MCLTIPVQVKEVFGKKALVKRGEEEFTVDLSFLPDTKPSDWLLVISGLALKRIEEGEAKEILDFLQYSFLTDPRKVSNRFSEIIRDSKIRPLTKEEIIYLLKSEGYEKEALLSEGNMTRKLNIKDFFCIHGVIEFSNYCLNDCLYCGLRSQSEILRYRMSKEEIGERVVEVVENKGYKLILLQSGEDPDFSAEDMAEIIKAIKERVRIFIFLSCGERGRDFYEKARRAGASGVLLRFETQNPKLFSSLHPKGKSLTRRFEHLKFLKEMGYFIATGFLIGLPGQTEEDIANDILTLYRIQPEMVSVGPFLPSPHTPLRGEKPPNLDLVLKVIAITRLLMRKVRIPVSTATETLHPDGRKLALQSGANALMFILTPKRYRRLYSLYQREFSDGENEIWEKYGLFKYEKGYDMLEERMAKEMR